jgi:ribosome-binding protein aMBF1 (putative translation factor)
MTRCELCGQDQAEHRWPGTRSNLLVCDHCLDRLVDDHAGRQEP